MRETKFTIVKAIAIICVVLSHAGAPSWILRTVYIFHVPVFFMCAGYFFNTKYLTDERTYLVHRIKGLYWPFLRWSVFFLIIHNLLFHCGLLSETFGNSQGGVTHPYTWHQFSQRLWSIVINMSGYDEFLAGAFWFFRALLLSSILYLILFKLFRRSAHFRTDQSVGWGIVIVSALLIFWKIGVGINMTGIAQGGYRELMGVWFMAAGFLMRQYGVVEKLTWRIAVPALLVLVAASMWFPSSMTWRPDMRQFLALPLPAVAGFLVLVYISTHINSRENMLKKIFVYVGDRTLYIFAFHLLAFKLVSALKVAWYDLPWEAIGGHPYVHEPANNAIFTSLYVFVGVGFPLLWLAGYRRVAARVTMTEQLWMEWGLRGGKMVCRIAFVFCRGVVRLFISIYKSLKQGIIDIIAASSPKNE